MERRTYKPSRELQDANVSVSTHITTLENVTYVDTQGRSQGGSALV